MTDNDQVSNAINAVTELTKAVPIYQDAIQPGAKQVGQALETVGKAINLVLAPVSMLVWGYDRIKDFVSQEVAERLKNVPVENIITPKPNVAGPALDALRYTGYESELSDLYANLLASSMDKDTAEKAHPAFVEIIKQLTPDEAKIIKLFLHSIPLPIITLRREFKSGNSEGKTGGADIIVNYSHIGELAGCQHLELTPTFLNNICRLGLAEIPEFGHYTTPGIYDALENSEVIIMNKKTIESDPNVEAQISKSYLRVTKLGKQFAEICTKPK